MYTLFFFYKFYLLLLLLLFFWLHWVFVAARRLSLVVASRATLCCSARASHCSGFSCCRAQALGEQGSVVVAHRLSSCGLRALERRLSSCGAWAQLLRGMWDLPGPGLEPMCPALAGRFLTTAPPGKPMLVIFIKRAYNYKSLETISLEHFICLSLLFRFCYLCWPVYSLLTSYQLYMTQWLVPLTKVLNLLWQYHWNFIA